MNSQQIPNRIDPLKYIGSGLELAGSIPLSRLTRLDGLLANSEGNAEVFLRFYRDEQKIAVILGKVEAQLNLLCQRCLGVDQVTIKSEFLFALVDEEDINHLPAMYEPLILEKPELNIYELIEEDLILAIPIVHYHDDKVVGGCLEFIPKTFGKIDSSVDEKPNPFSILEKLKN